MGRDGSVRAYATVDAEDYATLARFRWHLSGGYAIRHHGSRSRRTCVSMHRQVMGLGLGDPGKVDHWNRDKLDNRKENLRLATHAQNMMNVGANQGASSAYRGVSWNGRLNKWVASFRSKYLGCFDDELEAAARAAAEREAA